MEINQILDICKYDFINYFEATTLSPDKRDVIYYVKQEEYLVRDDPNNIPSSFPLPKYQLSISVNSFGFYSWFPSCKNDLAIVKENRTRPNPYTKYVSYSDNDPAHQLCSIITKILLAHGFVVGMSCTSRNEFTFTSTFMIMFAKSILNPFPIYIGIEIPDSDMFLCLNTDVSVLQRSYLIELILNKRQHIEKHKKDGYQSRI